MAPGSTPEECPFYFVEGQTFQNQSSHIALLIVNVKQTDKQLVYRD